MRARRLLRTSEEYGEDVEQWTRSCGGGGTCSNGRDREGGATHGRRAELCEAEYRRPRISVSCADVPGGRGDPRDYDLPGRRWMRLPTKPEESATIRCI